LALADALSVSPMKREEEIRQYCILSVMGSKIAHKFNWPMGNESHDIVDAIYEPDRGARVRLLGDWAGA
jgi:hypothetical protein